MNDLETAFETEPAIVLRAFCAWDLEAILVLASETAEAPQWSHREYKRILHLDPSSAFSRLGLVAHCGGTLAGFAVAGLSRLENIAELEAIVVHPRFRRRAIGGRLLIASKDFAEAAGATILRLEVRESNHGAIALYTAHGFHCAGRRRSYYSTPVEDALLLETVLEQTAKATPPGSGGFSDGVDAKKQLPTQPIGRSRRPRYAMFAC